MDNKLTIHRTCLSHRILRSFYSALISPVITAIAQTCLHEVLPDAHQYHFQIAVLDSTTPADSQSSLSFPRTCVVLPFAKPSIPKIESPPLYVAFYLRDQPAFPRGTGDKHHNSWKGRPLTLTVCVGKVKVPASWIEWPDLSKHRPSKNNRKKTPNQTSIPS